MDEKQIPWKWLKKGNGPIVLAQLTVKPLMVIFFYKGGRGQGMEECRERTST